MYICINQILGPGISGSHVPPAGIRQLPRLLGIGGGKTWGSGLNKPNTINTTDAPSMSFDGRRRRNREGSARNKDH